MQKVEFRIRNGTVTSILVYDVFVNDWLFAEYWPRTGNVYVKNNQHGYSDFEISAETWLSITNEMERLRPSYRSKSQIHKDFISPDT